MGSTRLAEQSGRRQKIELNTKELTTCSTGNSTTTGHKFKAVCLYECSSCAVLEEVIE